MRRYYQQAVNQAWALLPRLVKQPHLRHRTVAVLGDCLNDLACYEPALEVYDHLLSELPEDHPGVVQLQALRAIAALNCDRLTDGDDALRQVRQNLDPDESNMLAAAYHFAQLLQEVRTHHYREATQRGKSVIDQLRPLGVDAGFGYALMAWCHHRQQQRENEQAESDQTAEPSRDFDERMNADADETVDASSTHQQWQRYWWHNATLLVSPTAIVYRFPELSPLAEAMSP
jgi:tetratricopeptide (TPR) repeat protein